MKNIGLIGFGYWGPNIAKNLFLNPKVNLKWVCDRNINRLEKAKITYKSQVNYSQDPDEILNDTSLDGIAIAVETAGHYNLVKQSLLKKKHVFVEKPFTSTVDEAIELCKIANESQLKIHINHVMVYNSVIQKIKNLIVEGHIGDIIYIDAMRMNLGQIKKDVSAMWDLASHDLAVIDYLTDGKEPYFISSVGEKYYNPKESLSFLTLRYDNFISHIQSSWISPLKERKLVIVGTKKMIVFDDIKLTEKLTIYDKGVSLIPDENIEYGNYEIKIHEGDVWSPYIDLKDALYQSIDNFIDSMENEKETITGPSQAIRILKILEKADDRLNQ